MTTGHSKSYWLQALFTILFLLCAMSNGLCFVGFTFFSEAFCDTYAVELGCDEQKLRQCLEMFLRKAGWRSFLILGLPMQLVTVTGLLLVFGPNGSRHESSQND